MAIDRAEITGLVKTRLRLQDESLDALIDSYVQELEQRILNYCNIDEVPDGLKFVWASMTMDALRVEQPSEPAIADTVGGVSETTIGDTTVKSAQADGLTNTGKSVIDAVVLNYTVDLNRFRKLRW